MTATASPFYIQNVTISGGLDGIGSIFDDVQGAKAQLVEMRRAAKRRLDTNLVPSRPSQQSLPGNQLDDQSRVLKDLLSSETKLEESKALAGALQARKSELRQAILDLRSQLAAVKAMQVSAVDARNETSRSTIQNESDDDDLSTVVCPFELMGVCTDPVCRYMHLNR